MPQLITCLIIPTVRACEYLSLGLQFAHHAPLMCGAVVNHVMFHHLSLLFAPYYVTALWFGPHFTIAVPLAEDLWPCVCGCAIQVCN